LGSQLLLLVIRKWLYELFINTHYCLGILALVAIWCHVNLSKAFSRIYVLVGSSVLLFMTLLHWTVLLKRNISKSQIGCRAQIRWIDEEADQIDIHLARPFTVRAGMTVYICIPGVSLLSVFQSHPFAIAWWKNNEDGKASTISLLVQRRRGFTLKLLNLRGNQNTFLAWVDGPYGVPVNLDSYTRVLMIATGFGIAAQISYIKELLDDNDRMANREIFVGWELREESKCFLR
jgi:predicted ferric reductase